MKPSALALLVLGATAQNLTDRISADGLRGHVSFLASDLLQGRDTPSKGLDAAAEYIAAEFRRVGLESPAGLDYFQTALFDKVTDLGDSFVLTISGPKKRFLSVAPEHIAANNFVSVHLMNEPLFKWSPDMKVAASLAGNVLMLRAPSDRSVVLNLERAHPDAIVLIVSAPETGGWRSGALVPDDDVHRDRPPTLTVSAADVGVAFDRFTAGLTGARANINAVAPASEPVVLRNAIGVLPGSDPVLREQTILITAHYDHLGTDDWGRDRIYNGANDNASGVATVIELAAAFAKEVPRPKRTLVFLCLSGEEKDLLGSRYYVQHPVFALGSTIADINFEQMGEPDAEHDVPLGSLGVTGFAFTDLPQSLLGDAEQVGVKLRNTKHNDRYFDRSDNLAFAEAGIPAHTFVAAYDFPQYHQVSDEWRNLDYDNMAKLDRAMALCILDLANRPDAPRWNEMPQTKGFVSAWRALHR